MYKLQNDERTPRFFMVAKKSSKVGKAVPTPHSPSRER